MKLLNHVTAMRLGTKLMLILLLALSANADVSNDPRAEPLTPKQIKAMNLVEAKMEFQRQLRQWLIDNPNDAMARKELLSLLHNQYIADDRSYAVEVIGHLPADNRSRPKLEEEYYRIFFPLLVKTLNDEDYYVRRAAIDALGNFGIYAKEAVPKIAEFLKHIDKDISLHAARALGEIGLSADAAVPALIEALKKGPHASGTWVGEAAANALGEIGLAAKAAIPSLTHAAKTSHGEYRLRSVEALAKIDPGNADALAAFEDVFRTEEMPIRRSTANTLGILTKGKLLKPEMSVPILKRALGDKDWQVQQAAESALKECELPR